MKRKPRCPIGPLYPGETEEIDQEISNALRRLEEHGKSPSDGIALLASLLKSQQSEFSKSDWSEDQVRTALELGCLCVFRIAQSGQLAADPIALSTIGRWYGAIVRRQRDEMIHDMLPDWHRGKKAREKGAENHGSPAERAKRRERMREINREILLDWVQHKRRRLRSLTKIKRHKLIAKEYQKRYGSVFSHKTVERDLPYPRKKLDKPGLST